MTQEQKIQALADLVLEQSRARLAAQYSQWQADAETVEVIPGRVYTKINRGPRHNMGGMLMIEHSTGNVYGIKGYGVIHRGHPYGNLDTTADWYWGDYYPRPSQAPVPTLGATAVDASRLVAHLSTALEAARDIRDRAQAAEARGIRDDDRAEIARKGQFLATALSQAVTVHSELEPEVAALSAAGTRVS